MTAVTTVELRTGGGIRVMSIETEIHRSDYARLHCKGVSAGSRAKAERFYDQIDRDLAAWERSLYPKKKHRRQHGKKRNRYGKTIQLLKSDFRKEARHA